MVVTVTGGDGFLGKLVRERIELAGDGAHTFDAPRSVLEPADLDETPEGPCIHLAAHKHAPYGEDEPAEVAEVNILGTRNVVETFGPRVVLASLFGITALLGLFTSNTATAVLMAPVALAIAEELGASPYPFAMTVALAASAAFMTPVSSPVNTLVVGPGNYAFADFGRVGVPFTLVLVVSALLMPWLLPLR